MAFTDIHGDLPPAAQARAREAVEHLQAAARELILAARAGLDVAEEVVNDPESAVSVARTLAGAGELARHLSGFGTPRASGEGAADGRAADGPAWNGAGEPSPAPASRAAVPGGRARAPRVQRITVA